MTRSRVAWRVLLSALLLIGAAAPVAAQSGEASAEASESGPEARPGDRLGWHVVRPGDTLRDITERYLGTESLWRENHRLNPHIVNPNFLLPGQRLRVILERDLPARSAEVTQVARRVEQKPQPNDWRTARRGDLLAERDGLRTFARSSAELTFDDGAELQVSENSLVFLQRLGASLTGVQQETVEIVNGQADLAVRSQPREIRDIEIVVSGATARPKPGPDGRTANRARAGDASAQLMVYAGRSEVESGGAKVDVPRGMGTVVPEGEPPKPPERLLPAPRLDRPAAGASFAYGNPIFAWRQVSRAASYTVEVCRDAACAELVDRAVGLEDTTWQASRLPSGDLYWRVTAVAESGLDGFPADGRPIAVAADGDDIMPPAVAIVRRGAGSSRSGQAVIGEGAVFLLSAHDDVSGVERVSYRWDGGEWRRWRGEELAPRGEVLEVQAVDRAGRESEIWRVTVRTDREAPEPPRIGG